MTASLPPADITGLVLSGGQGIRMGGVDKGLQPFHGMPLALNALRRLAPQVGRVAVNANRHLDVYAAMGAPVWPDAITGYAGPLAGFLAGLAHCETPYLATVPCDSPRFPEDLIARLSQALLAAGADIARVATMEEGALRPQPVFCLMKVTVAGSLARFIHDGERKVGLWMRQHRCIDVPFDDADAFFNANTLEDLQQAQSGPIGPMGPADGRATS